MTTTVAVLLPTGDNTPPELVLQMLEGVRTHYRHASGIQLFCHEATKARYAELLPGLPIEVMAGQFVPCTDLAMLMSLFGQERTPNLQVPNTAKTFMISWEGRCLPMGRGCEGAELQNIDAHVFNRLSPPQPWGFYYFPFQYLFRYLGMGPIDKFGFRITRSLAELAKRPKRHKVVACFGGSACWSPYALHHQMHTEVLEKRLNEHCRKAGHDLEFTVVNMGQHGNMVMNEMLNWVLYCHDLKPDIVIAHDGYNDMVYGQMCDPRLLSESMAYQENLEGWSQILHQTSQYPRTQNELPYRAVNQPLPVLKAYTRRKRQFADLVTQSGGFFIWGLQPAACSKKRRPDSEDKLVALMYNRDYAPVVSNVEGLFQMLIKGLKLPEGIPFVDCHTAFGGFAEKSFLLGDDVHLVAAGDAVLAQLYGDTIARTYIDTGRWRQ